MNNNQRSKRTQTQAQAQAQQRQCQPAAAVASGRQRQHRLSFDIGPKCARKTRAGGRVVMPEELGRRHRVVGWQQQQLLTFYKLMHFHSP
jgi:hypothetical protein